jgi:hypothetical protein
MLAEETLSDDSYDCTYSSIYFFLPTSLILYYVAWSVYISLMFLVSSWFVPMRSIGI